MISEILLVISIFLNVFMFFYARWLIRGLSISSENLRILQGNISDFSLHIESIHESEMFYGDETLQGLIEHSRKLKEEINDFNNILLPEEEEEILEESE